MSLRELTLGLLASAILLGGYLIVVYLENSHAIL